MVYLSTQSARTLQEAIEVSVFTVDTPSRPNSSTVRAVKVRKK